ncbi:MAG: hypothetical protein PW844_18460 [Pantoea sp.]|uniref:hypothetical protein n=1 Tax=Pantoea sp. TaxID=69393 RepID=UPI0023831AAA|nr:hypothetical protein [Pantoea sp.]MDE1188439.1 hypothetical protein [Pantoea sp.]
MDIDAGNWSGGVVLSHGGVMNCAINRAATTWHWLAADVLRIETDIQIFRHAENSLQWQHVFRAGINMSRNQARAFSIMF